MLHRNMQKRVVKRALDDGRDGFEVLHCCLALSSALTSKCSTRMAQISEIAPPQHVYGCLDVRFANALGARRRKLKIFAAVNWYVQFL